MADVVAIQYDQMHQIKSQFEQQSQFIKQTMDELTNHMQVLQSGGWIADAADAFYGSMNDDVLLGVQRLIQALVQSAETCELLIQRYEAAEEETRASFPTTF